MLTKLLKEHGKDKVKEVALKTLKDEAVEQVPYMIELLKETEETRPVWQMTDIELFALATQKGIPTRGKTRQQLINELR